MKEINLIDSQKKKGFGFYRHIKLFRTIIIFLNLALVLIMGIFLLIYLDSTKKFKDHELKITALKTEIGKFNKEESYLITIDNRLKKIDGILKTRTSQTDFLTKIKELFIEGYSFSSLDIGDQKESRITGSCLDNQCLSLLYSKAEELKAKKSFSEFIFSDISRNLKEPFGIGIALKN